MRAKRLFVSLDLPPAIAQLLVRLDSHLPGLRWVPGEQLHLTLGFFGNVEPEAEELLRSQLSAIRFSSFFLPLYGLGTFPPKGQPKVVWLGIGAGHPHLFQLHKRVADAALGGGIEPDLRPWHPHVTLARCQHDMPAASVRKFLRANHDFDAGLVPFDRFHLKSSRLTSSGSIHETELTVFGN